jgi:arylsulfatase A-like enzyme
MPARYLILLVTLLLCGSQKAAANDRPNIVWIIVDDMSANFSCYGETLIETPNVDALAARGTRFTQAFVTAPVCSTCRSAFITGMYQTSIGAHHHRSGRGAQKIDLPVTVRPLPELFREAGYHTSITGWPVRKGRLGKTDYNFEWDKAMYNDVDWSSRRDGQPFFTQIQLPGGKLRGGTQESAERFAQQIEQTFGARTQTSDVVLPPYYPRDPVLLHDWAAYLDSVRETDRVVGEILDRLKTDGVLGQTVVLVMTDHGISHARGKQFLYEEGIHVPLVIAGPGISPAKTRTDLVEHIDIAALSLGLAGIPQPETMQARDILAENYQPRDAIFSARDRCDETVDHIRCVRTTRFKYIRNFLPQRPHLQPCAYKDSKSILITLRAAHAAGRLNALQQQLLFSPTRPSEELYDLQKDPHELTNLATDPAHQSTLNNLRSRLNNWIDTTADQGREPESTQSYDSDMQVYLDSLRGGKANPKRSREIESNIARMKSWAAAGQ